MKTTITITIDDDAQTIQFDDGKPIRLLEVSSSCEPEEVPTVSWDMVRRFREGPVMEMSLRYDNPNYKRDPVTT